jgi:8-oxo-dGTP diphosphatase
MQILHEIQRNILLELLMRKSATFTELKPADNIEGSHLTFHLKQLIKKSLIYKEEDRYFLTDKGKEFANREQIMKKNPKEVIPSNTIILICRRQDRYLTYTRKKHPFYGFQGFPSGKILAGELVLSAAKRNLKEKTGLRSTPQIISVNHRIILDSLKKDVLEDKYLYLCLFERFTGDESFDSSGDYKWIQKDKIDVVISKPYHLFKKYLDLAEKFDAQITFSEEKIFVDEF